jgi:hypothetical protein
LNLSQYKKEQMDNINNVKDTLLMEYQILTNDYWKFLNYGWPEIEQKKYHTKKIISIKKIKEIKKILLEKLGIIPVYFFLVILFGDRDYRGPYNNIEKGLLILYFIVENISIEDMDDYISKSTFHQIYRQFYSSDRMLKLNKILSFSLQNMFSNIKIRLLNGMIENPDLFNQVTIHLDGHDKRGMVYGAEDKSIYYSYKLKKNGFRTQVAIDTNGMVLFVSDSQPCSTNNDGSMLINMNIENKLNLMDCIALDGGYSLYVDNIINSSDLNDYNFVYPIRKDKNINLNEIEINYNDQFGSFRSKMEKTFSDLGCIFKRLNNKKPFLTTNINIYNIQLKIACVLFNLKKYIKLNNIEHSDFHSYWINDSFDFKYKNDILNNNENYKSLPKLNERINNLDKMKLLQQQFLGLELSNIAHFKNNNIYNNEKMDLEIDIDNNESYEIETILDHKGLIVEDSYYLVKWQNYSDEDNSWVHYSKFNSFDYINIYWNSK